VSGVSSVGLGWPVGGLAAITPAVIAGWLGWLVAGVGTIYLILALTQAVQMMTRWNPPKFLRSSVQAVRPFHITNTYGLFANMTTDRPEITVEGSQDGENWKQYEFRYKPNGPESFPAQAAPHQPRLDWQMWFAGLRNRPPVWFQAFVQRLKEGSQPVENLLAHNPFADSSPTYVRARIQNYEFTDFSVWRKTGRFWRAGESRIYLPEILDK
jgi:hypothetical protein